MTEASPVFGLRARPEPIRLSGTGAPITVRVEVPEVWDTVRLDVTADLSLVELKRAALSELMPDATNLEEFVIKFRGFMVFDEHVTLAEVGASDGSTFLVTSRRRNPVK